LQFYLKSRGKAKAVPNNLRHFDCVGIELKIDSCHLNCKKMQESTVRYLSEFLVCES
jgi:hypothetical protein